MSKPFDDWNEKKKYLEENNNASFYFKEGEVWWAFTGINVGYEENGKGSYFVRPVVIIRKFNQHLTYAVPLTTSTRMNPYYIDCAVSDGKKRQAIVSQCKSMSSKRFKDKIGSISKIELEKIKNAVKQALDGIPEIYSVAEDSAIEPEGHL